MAAGPPTRVVSSGGPMAININVDQPVAKADSAASRGGSAVIQLYGMSSPNVFKVSIMLEEVGLPWSLTYVDILQGDQFEPAFLKVGPNNKVPVIVDPDGPDGGPFAVFE